jgi:hypothetical protein
MWSAWALWCAGHTLGLSESTWLIDDDRVVVEAVFHREEALAEPLLTSACDWQLEHDGPVAGDGRSLRLSSLCQPQRIGLSEQLWQQLGADHRHRATWSGVHRGEAVWSSAIPDTELDPRRTWLALWMVALIWSSRRQPPTTWLWMTVAVACGWLLGPTSALATLLVTLLLTAGRVFTSLGVVGATTAATVLGMQTTGAMSVVAMGVLAGAALHARTRS